MPIFMKFDGIDGEVVEAARAPAIDSFLFASTSTSTSVGDDVVVDGRIITGENPAAAAHAEGRQPGEMLTLNFEEIKVEMAASRDSAAAEQDLLVAGDPEAVEKDHDKWTELTSFSNGAHKPGGAAWDGGDLGVLTSDLDLF